MALSIDEALPRVVDTLIEFGLRERIRVIAAGKLVTSARVAWALACGADFVNTARGFMFSLGCVQAMRCHQNTCPDRYHHPQSKTAAWPGGGGEVPAGGQLCP